MSKDEVKVLDHDYDGIQEFDHPLPMWWLITFFAAIIFGFHYWIHYEFGGGQTQAEELRVEMEHIQTLKKSAPGNTDSTEQFNQLLASPEALAKGQAVYTSRCAVCHGPELQGMVGPNLTDAYWIHGRGGLLDIAKVIRLGVLDKGMPAWESQIASDEIQAVTVFIAKKQGSNPPNPKPPQGEKVGN